MLKIGDKVRFLNDVGGGTVSGFQGKDIVLVADEDGFEIPTLISEVVAVETDDYNIAKVVAGQKKKKKEGPMPTSVKNALDVMMTMRRRKKLTLPIRNSPIVLWRKSVVEPTN